MKLVTLLFIILLVVFVGSLTMGGCSTYVPYSPDMLFSRMFPYEGFSINPLEYAPTSDKPTASHKLAGFSGIYGTADNSGNSLDIFSTAPGDMTCTSYGYANSRGFLCMDQEQSRLLRSRGGNASGGDMQIR